MPKACWHTSSKPHLSGERASNLVKGCLRIHVCSPASALQAGEQFALCLGGHDLAHHTWTRVYAWVGDGMQPGLREECTSTTVLTAAHIMEFMAVSAMTSGMSLQIACSFHVAALHITDKAGPDCCCQVSNQTPGSKSLLDER